MHDQPKQPPTRPPVRLTVEQCVFMADQAAGIVADYGAALGEAWADPQEVRDLYSELGPYVGLIAELQDDDLEVTRTGTLRLVAERVRADAFTDLAYERGWLAKSRAGDPGWPELDMDEAEAKIVGELDRHLGKAALAIQVLERLDGTA